MMRAISLTVILMSALFGGANARAQQPAPAPAPAAAQMKTDAEYKALEDAFPDWRTIVGAVDIRKQQPDPNNAFRKWLATKDAAYQTLVNSSNSPAVIARSIRTFLSETKPASAGPFEDGLAAHDLGDYPTALRLWMPLARQGNAPAQVNLGLMYDKGQGVPQNHAEAVKWWRLAADQGNATAQSNLGNMYVRGQGVPQNFVLAHMWYNLASAGGNAGAANFRDLIAARMTPAQIAEAQRLAAEWKRK